MEVNELSDLINDLMCLPTLASSLHEAARVATEAQTVLVNLTTSIPVKLDNKCDKCGEPVPLDALFWHNHRRTGFFCKKCFRELEGEDGKGYVTLEKSGDPKNV